MLTVTHFQPLYWEAYYLLRFYIIVVKSEPPGVVDHCFAPAHNRVSLWDFVEIHILLRLPCAF